ncbi:uncharacterized protein METZ01_LOCUS179828 [marine metagenome]|uniref:Uncharacterized protein n=1 Tax=marine metagenome TaxID=408172 RepID=A0A382CMA9_9ZZZZ
MNDDGLFHATATKERKPIHFQF